MSIKYIHIYKALRKNDGQLKAYREILVGVKNQFFRPETAFERRRKHIFMIKPHRKTALKSNERQGFLLCNTGGTVECYLQHFIPFFRDEVLFLFERS